MMGETCLEVQDDAPDKIKNNRGDAISNTRGVDAEQLNLKKTRERMVQSGRTDLNVNDCQRKYECTDFTLTSLSSRKARAFEMLFSLKMRRGDDLNL